MRSPRTPADELERLQALKRLLILDTAPEQRFDGVTAYCKVRFGVDSALITLVDAERQWFKSSAGIGVKETPRDVSFCGHAILAEAVMLVPDTHLDERFVNNPFVTGEPFIRFYAGAPLVSASGHRVGTLCLIHSRPCDLPPEEARHLTQLAAAVSLDLQQRADGMRDAQRLGQLGEV